MGRHLGAVRQEHTLPSPAQDRHESGGRSGRGPALAWEVVGMSGWDRDQWPKTALGRPKALAFPKDLACGGVGWGVGPTQALPRNAYCLWILSLAQAGVLGHLAG